MSKYKEVYNDIKNKIKTGTINPGGFLKSESELAQEYSYSKDTIRKALSLLEVEGFIQKIKGKNSLVLEKTYLKNISLSSIQTFQELNKIKNLNVKTEVISLYIVQGIKELMKTFQVSEKADFYKVTRTYCLDGEVLSYDISYFDRKIVPFLNKKIAQKSIYEYIEKELKLKISHSRREIKFRHATPEEKKYIDLKDFNMVVIIETHAYLSNGSLFQYEITAHRPDKFTFSAIAKR
ncbi:UTRA domain-containing protein [Leptotrichia sp. OH3620_COT-345]|uniref:UTRA domain-containing protein n=1 Tax=Leptotrichia sp. OH3620_COT-345 TaxID=2491048 RepID=UPI000F649B0F|nr:UTRA domain-containing protein [Leptotrichia sp. OH3620_COT-345]RRD40206.1 UTRA domain-containing protein [Leptotrichia sp. OH3620_COT-345]